MVKHTVMFRFKPFATAQEKNSKVVELRDALLALKGIVPEIESIEVFANQNPKESFDLVLISTHRSWQDLAVYDQNPDHMAVKARIKQVLDFRAAADAEF